MSAEQPTSPIAGNSPIAPIFDVRRHEALDSDLWNEDLAVGEIRKIVADFEEAVLPTSVWPTHPLDDTTLAPKWALYSGAAGVVVSLRLLRKAGYCIKDWSSMLPEIHRQYLLAPDYGYETGLQLGEIGILTPLLLSDPDDRSTCGRLVECMRETVNHPAREITSGAAGMMHAALALFNRTGNIVWKELYRDAAQSLWDSWHESPETGEWHWESHIFKGVRSYYGACHGVAGNVQALMRGIDHLPADWGPIIVSRALKTLSCGAVKRGSRTNWPLSAESDAVGAKRLVQWCHGAPGVVTALAHVDPVTEKNATALHAILLNAAELVWEAGPLVKGPGICHGTAGNGFAFLALYHRTGNPLWLKRARQFAMHAIKQSHLATEEYGHRRYTLWTGDGGLAIYLHQCVAAAAPSLPGLEDF